jgi:uncharacterized integral membrane protein
MGDDGKHSERVILTASRLTGMAGVALILSILVLFVADNFVLIEIRLVNVRVQTRLAWALLIAVLGGGIVGFLLARRRP